MRVYTFKRTYKYDDEEHTHESKLYHTVSGIKQVLRDNYYDKDTITVQEYDLVFNREVDRATFLSEKGSGMATFILCTIGTHTVQYTGNLIAAKEHYAATHNVHTDHILVEVVTVIRV